MSLPTTIAIGSIGALAATGLVSMQDLPGSLSQRTGLAPSAVVIVAETDLAKPTYPVQLRQLPQTAALSPVAIMSDASPRDAMVDVAQAGVPTQLVPVQQEKPKSQPKTRSKDAGHTAPPITPTPAMAAPTMPGPQAEPVSAPAEGADAAPMMTPSPAPSHSATPTPRKPRSTPAAAKTEKAKPDHLPVEKMEQTTTQRAPIGATGSFVAQVHSFDGIIAAEKALLAKTAFRATYQAHIASYASEEDAMMAWEEISSQAGKASEGVLPRLVRVEVPEKGAFVRLIAGDFTNVESSAAFCSRLMSMKLDCRIMRDATHGGEG